MSLNSVTIRVEGEKNFHNTSATHPPQHTQESLFNLPTALRHHLLLQPVPHQLTVGNDERFWLVESETSWRIPGQFTRAEADFIWKITQHWNWEVESTTREPACRVQLMPLLEEICQRTSGNVSLSSFSAEEGAA